MAEKQLRFRLSELKTIRVICRQPVCGAIVEIPIEALEKVFSEPRCPVCESSFAESISTLGHAIHVLSAVRDLVDIEFVIPTRD
jgi:hypothetical protein